MGTGNLRWLSSGLAAGLAFLGHPGASFAVEAPAEAPQIAPHPRVEGTELKSVEVASATKRDFHPTAWADLARTARTPGDYALRFSVAGGNKIALEIPVCAGRGRVLVDGNAVATGSPGPVVVPLPSRPEQAYDVEIEVHVSNYERRIACGAPPRFGAELRGKDGLGVLSFMSPHAALGGGHAVVFVPPGHDAKKPATVLVGCHPWNGTPWTYAAYGELVSEAATKDVVLLQPSGLGNSLYTAPAEEEVLRALDALAQVVAIDPRRVSIWGASMGGAGATTIGLHHPDRFASVTSFFGDSRYDLSTYVKSILRDETGAHLVNALDVVDNARHVPIWLVHGESDVTSPIAQSILLARALEERHFQVRFDRVPAMGHSGALVARFAAEVVDRAAAAERPASPERVTFTSVRPQDTSAYGVHVARTGIGDAFVDVELRDKAVHVRTARGIRSLELARGALGTSPAAPPPPIVVDDASAKIETRWAEAER